MEKLKDYLNIKKEKLNYQEIKELVNNGSLKDIYLLQENYKDQVIVDYLIYAPAMEEAEEKAQEEFEKERERQWRSGDHWFSNECYYSIFPLSQELNEVKYSFNCMNDDEEAKSADCIDSIIYIFNQYLLKEVLGL